MHVLLIVFDLAYGQDTTFKVTGYKGQITFLCCNECILILFVQVEQVKYDKNSSFIDDFNRYLFHSCLVGLFTLNLTGVIIQNSVFRNIVIHSRIKGSTTIPLPVAFR